MRDERVNVPLRASREAIMAHPPSFRGTLHRMPTAAPHGSNPAPLRAIWPMVFLASPLVLLFFLLRDPSVDPVVPAPEVHFAIVTFTAIAGEVLAAVLLVIAERLREPRGFYIGLAFASMASFYFVHGLLTPGIIFERASTGIHWAPLVGLSLAAGCLAVSTIRPGAHWILRGAGSRRRSVARLALSSHLIWVRRLLERPHTVDRVPRARARPRTGVLRPTSTASGVVVDGKISNKATPLPVTTPARHTVRVDGRPLLRRQASGGPPAPCRATARWIAPPVPAEPPPSHARSWGMLLRWRFIAFVFASVWRISWWEYNVLALLGIGVVVYGLSLDYQGGAQASHKVRVPTRGTSSEPPAVIVPGALYPLTAAFRAVIVPSAPLGKRRLRCRSVSDGGCRPKRFETVLRRTAARYRQDRVSDGILHSKVAQCRGIRGDQRHRGVPRMSSAFIPLRSLGGGHRWHHEVSRVGLPDGRPGTRSH